MPHNIHQGAPVLAHHRTHAALEAQNRALLTHKRNKRSQLHAKRTKKINRKPTAPQNLNRAQMRQTILTATPTRLMLKLNTNISTRAVTLPILVNP